MSERPRPGRISPFLLPSATSTQFVLLVFALLGGTIFLYNYLLVIASPRFSDTISGCLSDAMAALRPSTLSPSTEQATVAAYDACWTGVGRVNSLLALSGIGIVLVLTFVMYLLHPVFYRVSHRLRAVPATPGLADELAALVAQARLARSPKFLLRLKPDAQAYSFGLAGRYCIVLHQGLLWRYRGQPDLVRAIIRHELSHVRNRDIARTQWALAAWRAFGLAAALPFIVYAFEHPSTFLTRVIVSVAVILTTIYLSTLSVLRVREYYADVRASEVDGATGAIGSLLHDAASRSATGWRDRLSWRKRRHPRESDRDATVRDPGRLLRTDLAQLLIAGLAIGIGYRSFPAVVTGLKVGINASWNTFIASVITVALGTLIAGSVGLMAWRSAVPAVIHRTALPSMTVPGIVLAAGILAGTSINNQQVGSWWLRVTTSPVAGVITAVVLVSITVFFLQWSMTSAAAWLDVTHPRQWRRVAIAGVVAGGIVAGPLFAAWFDSLVNEPVVGLLTLVQQLLSGLLVGSAIVACAWPLTAGLRLPRRPHPADVNLDQAGAIPVTWAGTPFRPLVPVITGTVAVAAFIVPAIVMREGVKGLTDATVGQTTGALTGFALVAALIQAVAAMVAAGIAGVRQATLGAAHGLAAAVVAGIGMIAVTTVVILGPVCADKPGTCLSRLTSIDWYQIWILLIIGIGVLVATPGAWLISWLARGLAELQGDRSWPQPPAYLPRRPYRLPAGYPTRVTLATAGGAAFCLVALLAVLPFIHTRHADATPAINATAQTPQIGEPEDHSLTGLCSWATMASFQAMEDGPIDEPLGPSDAVVGTTVAESDDALMRAIGHELAAAARASDSRRYAIAQSALGYRCIQATTQ